QYFGDALAIFHGRLTADVRIGSGAQALGDGRAELQHGARFDLLQRLCVGVGTDEFHAFDVVAHHVIDRVAAATTDADDLDDCTLRGMIYEFEHVPLSFQLSSCGTALLRNCPGSSSSAGPGQTVWFHRRNGRDRTWKCRRPASAVRTATGPRPLNRWGCVRRRSVP